MQYKIEFYLFLVLVHYLKEEGFNSDIDNLFLY
jgi:hypothetical protein